MRACSGLIIAVALGALCLGGCAATGTTRSDTAPTVNQFSVTADTKANFEAEVATVHKQIQPGGRWQYIEASERRTIDDRFGDMGKLFDQYGSVDKMDQATRAQLQADKNVVNTILAERDGYRLICRSEAPIGSRLPVRTCKTYAQIQAEHDTAQQMLRDRAHTSPGVKPPGDTRN